MAYQEWLKRYQGELLARTGMSPEDGFSEDCLNSFYKEKASPVEVVDWLIEKYALTDLQAELWNGDIYDSFRRVAKDLFGYAPPARVY